MNFQLLSLSRQSFLGRSISRHLREFHRGNSTPDRSGRNVSRRNFLSNAASAAGLAFWIPELGAAQGNGKSVGKSSDPKPIPGGGSPLGISVHHFPAQLTATPLASLNEPSQITDFKGFVGLNRIRGEGRGSGFADKIAFQADMGFMKGQFIAEDGKLHEGVFGFIWLDIFNGPVGPPPLFAPPPVTQQIHDYAPTIPPSGLFWTMPLHPNSVEVEFNSARASMHAEGLSVPDAHDLANSLTHGQGGGLANPPIPAIPPIAPVPAIVSFDVQWSGEIAGIDGVSRTTVVNDAQNFRGDFIKTGSTMKWSSVQNGFFFESEDPNPVRCNGATIGRERNGVFFSQEDGH